MPTRQHLPENILGSLNDRPILHARHLILAVVLMEAGYLILHARYLTLVVRYLDVSGL